MSERLWAIRGAAQADANDEESILAATRELVSELMERNGLRPESFVSVIFTATDDLNAQFPAVAARELGFGEIPLLCNREMEVPGAMERVIRLLAHYYGPSDHSPQHVYLGETKKLRVDLHSAQ
jgi:chorismate mutase